MDNLNNPSFNDAENNDNNVSKCIVKSRKKRNLIDEQKFEQIKRLYKIDKPKKIASLLDLSVDAINKAIIKIEREDNNLSFDECYKKPGRPGKNWEEEKRMIRNFFEEDNSLTQVGCKLKLEEMGINISLSRLNMLVKDCGLIRKRLKKRCKVTITESHFVQKRAYANEFNRCSSRNIVFLDESGFNLHTSINYGYSPANIDPIKIQPASKGQNLSLCAIISRSGLLSNMIIDGGYDSETFIRFIETAHNEGVFSPNTVIVLDNASIHRSRQVTQKFGELGVQVLFLPPYSPELNPIENFFSSVKARLNRIRPRANTRNVLKGQILNVLNSYEGDNEMFENLYLKTWEYIYGILNGTE